MSELRLIPGDLAADAPPMALAGRYLRMRREAARVAGLLVGLALANHHRELAAAGRYALAEEGALLLSEAELLVVAGFFPFRREVYLNLAAGLPIGTILCRGCGCSWDDACIERLHGVCAWVIGDATLCTRCEREGRG